MKPYIISEDIALILNGAGWLSDYYKKKGIEIPDEDTITDLRKDFKRDLERLSDTSEVILVPEADLQGGLRDCVQKSGEFIVSLDCIYLAPEILQERGMFLDTTRLYDLDKPYKAPIQVPRSVLKGENAYPLDQQIAKISQKIKEKLGKSPEVILIDDVIFSGDGVLKIVELLKQNGIKVKKCIAGMVLEQGEEKLKKAGITIERVSPIKECTDQVCERDFYFGIPHSGVMIRKKGKIMKAPYFLPFGDPVARASIPEKTAVDFSLSCLKRSLRLYLEMENLSGRRLRVAELPERIYGTKPTEPVVVALQRAQNRLKNKNLKNNMIYS